MKKSTFALLGAAAASMFIASAMADSASGPGGPIPAVGTGGGGTWQTTLPPTPFDSTAVLPNAVGSVQSIVMNVSITHTWIGDMQAVLYNPAGIGYNIFVRPGSTGGSLGNSGDWLAGTYTYRDPSFGDAPMPTSGNSTPGSTYAQSYADWVSGGNNIFNTGLNSVSGGAGNWRLVIYDWAAGDVGALSGWTINYTPVPAPGALALLGLAGMVGSRRRR